MNESTCKCDPAELENGACGLCGKPFPDFLRAVQQATTSLIESDALTPTKEGSDIFSVCTDVARQILEAIGLPTFEARVRETVAREIEAGVLPNHPTVGFRDGLRRAAMIARNR